jgi:hypothetical protein
LAEDRRTVSLLNVANEEHQRPAGTPQEFLVSACLLPLIHEKYSSSFGLLEIPEVLRIDESLGQHGTLFFREYHGQKYNDRWSEQMGGSALGPELSSEMVRLIEDFRRINIDWLSAYPVGKGIIQASFDLQDWLRSLRDRGPLALSWGISDDEIRRAEKLIEEGFGLTERILCNGDFYPRNLIKTEQKMVVVDWGYWPGNRACYIDYLPNVVAFAFVHMWNNDEWQKKFLGSVLAVLGADPEDLRKAIVIKAFEQAFYWRDLSFLLPPQIKHFRMALEDRLPLS